MITVPYVDEDPIMCSLVSRIFEKTGEIVVHSSVSGEEALAWAFTHHADMIVSDNGLPGISGTDLLKVLVAGGIFAPFVVLTRHVTESLKTIVKIPGVFRFNSKEGTEEKQILKRLRFVYWVTVSRETR
jgi:CheY-like chemotaxis protein